MQETILAFSSTAFVSLFFLILDWWINFSSMNIIQVCFFHTTFQPLPPQRLTANKAFEVEGSGDWELLVSKVRMQPNSVVKNMDSGWKRPGFNSRWHCY